MVQEVRFYGNGKLLGSAPLGNIISLELVDPETSFGETPPVVEITGGGGEGAQAQANLDENGNLISVSLTNGGRGYVTPPTVSLSPSNGAIVTATIDTEIRNNSRNIPGTNRWVIDWAPQAQYIQYIGFEAIDDDLSSAKISTDRWIVVTPMTSSLPPQVKLNSPPNGSVSTSGSKMYFYALADDLDGTLEWIGFYVNGDPYGDPISAYLGKSSSKLSLWYRMGSSCSWCLFDLCSGDGQRQHVSWNLHHHCDYWGRILTDC